MPFSKIIQQIQKVCGKDSVSVRENDRIAYSRDCSTSGIIEIRDGTVSHPPDLIVWPKDEKEISAVLKIANKAKVPIIPYGAGSGVCGGTIPLKGGIILDLKKLDRLLSIDSDHQTVTAESGILGEILERKLQFSGWTLGHFPSSIYTATLGGYLACRSAGQLSTKYGKIEDMVQKMRVCLADGSILDLSESKTDLRELFIGNEGTLGIITRATLKIHPKPETEKYYSFRFPTVQKGLQAIRHFMQAGLRPAVVRLYDPFDSLFFTLGMGSGKEETESKKSFLEGMPASVRHWIDRLKKESTQQLLSRSNLLNQIIDWSFSKSLLILGFQGAEWKVKEECDSVREICLFSEGEELGEAAGLQWLKKRYNAGYKMSPIVDQACFADTMEVATNWNQLIPLYQAVRKAIQPHALIMAHFSHVYPDGASIYFTFAGYASDTSKSLQLHQKIWKEGLEACRKVGATITHHHGVGFLKADALKQEWGPLHNWFKSVKKELDPNGILNPGKLGLPLELT